MFFLPILCPAQWDWGGGEDTVIYVAKPDTIFWVTDLEGFARDNELQFINEDGEDSLAITQKPFRMLANYFQYMAAFEWGNAHIAIKEKDKYRVWPFSEFVPQFSSFYYDTTIMLGKRKCLVFMGNFEFLKHGYNPVMNNYSSFLSSITLLDLENNEVVFSHPISEGWSQQYIWGIEEYEYANKENGLSEEEYNRIYAFDTAENQRFFIQPWAGGDTLDTWEYPDTSASVEYAYYITGKKIEYYKLPAESYYDSQETRLPQTTNKKPDFWYEYIEKEKKWVRKSGQK